jgi:hypothetical protein
MPLTEWREPQPLHPDSDESLPAWEPDRYGELLVNRMYFRTGVMNEFLGDGLMDVCLGGTRDPRRPQTVMHQMVEP